MRGGYRAKIFFATFSVAAAGLLLFSTLISVSLPPSDASQQLRTIWRFALYVLAVSVVGAFGAAWIVSSALVRRLRRLASGARRYADGDVAGPPADYEDDEIGTIAKELDESVRRLGERASDLARDRAQMEAILAGMVEGVVVIDAHGRMRIVNAAARRMLRIDGDVAGRHYLECVRHPVVVSHLNAAQRGDVQAEATPSVMHEGTAVFLARAAPVASAGGRGAVLVLHDITDLQRADQIRRDFVANVSHELRTPLTAIRGYVEALRDEPIDPGERRKFLGVITRHTVRMERLARDLLRLASLEGGQEPPEYSACSVDDLFAGVVADLQLNIDRKRQRVQFTGDPSVSIVTADPQQLHDALRNLVENAVIYSPAGSLVTLAARREQDQIVIDVEDEGPGIPQADLSRVFERFYRVDKARSRESGGTGLGLAIVKHIVERMGGSVRASNRAGSGAVFTLRLPFRTAAQPIGVSGGSR